MNAIGVAVLFCAVQVTAFVAVAGALYLAMFRRDPTRAARLGLASMAGVAVLTALCWSPWPNWAGSGERAATTVEAGFRGETRTSATTAGEPASPAENAAKSRASDLSLSMSTVSSLWEGLRQVWAGEIAPAPTTRWNWLDWVAVAFVVAAALGLVRLVAGLVGVAWLRRGGVPLTYSRLTELADILRAELGCGREVALVECRSLATAATVGWRRPIVLLPSGWRDWSADELRAVLAHEIAHVRRGDFVAQLVSQLGLALHSYHPLVHWLARRLRLEQELAADAAAARVAGGRQSYLTTLAGLALAQPAARVAWPAQAFIPSRHMFLRRIEMLRDSHTAGSGSSAARIRQRIFGWISALVLCAAGVAAVGLRAPSVARADAETADGKSDTKAAATAAANGTVKKEYDFSYVPENTMALLAIRQSELVADPRLRPLAELLDENTRPAIPSKLAEQSTLALVAPDLDEQGRIRAGFSPEQIIIHTTEPVDFEAYLKKAYPSLSTIQDGGREIMVIGPHPSSMSFFAPNKQTLLGRVRPGLVKMLGAADAAKSPAGAETWNKAAQGPILFMAKSAPSDILFKGRNDVATAMLMPLLTGADTLMLWIEPSENLRLVGQIICKSPEDAKRVAETAGALAELARNAVVQMHENLVQGSDSQAGKYRQALSVIGGALRERKVTSKGNDVHLEMSLGETTDTVKLIVETVAPAIKAARGAAQRTQSTNNLKQIGLAMHHYADKEKHFPPAVLIGPDGKTPYSWRVALLPYFKDDGLCAQLYRQYRFDQPWDSADNRRVLEQMPTVYRHPMDESASSSSYFLLTGPDTVFSDGKGTKLADITDGTSKTILAVEAKRDIPWTKPEDIAYTADGPAPKLGGWSADGFNSVFCDGAGHFLSNDIQESVLRAVITKAGREVIDRDDL